MNFPVSENFFLNKSYSWLMPNCSTINDINDTSFWDVLLILNLSWQIWLQFFYFSSNCFRIHEAHSESVLAEIIISRVHLDKAPVTTTIVENEMLRSRRVSVTTTPLSFWKTPERKLSLTLIRRHVTAILIESPPVPDEERQRSL